MFRQGPIKNEARELLEVSRALGENHKAGALRASCVAHLFRRSEAIFASGEDPGPQLRRVLSEAAF